MKSMNFSCHENMAEGTQTEGEQLEEESSVSYQWCKQNDTRVGLWISVRHSKSYGKELEDGDM